AQPGEERAPREPREDGDRNGRRGRRRRGGRNRNRGGRDRDREPREGGAPREQHQPNGEQPAVAAEGGDGEFIAGPEDMAEGGEQFASEHGPENGGNGQPRQAGENARRRRRRRGRRGGHRARFQNGEQQPMAAPADGAPHS